MFYGQNKYYVDTVRAKVRYSESKVDFQSYRKFNYSTCMDNIAVTLIGRNIWDFCKICFIQQTEKGAVTKSSAPWPIL